MHHIFALYRMTIIFNVKYQNLLQWHLIFRILSTTFASIKFAYNHHTPIIYDTINLTKFTIIVTFLKKSKLLHVH